MWLVYELKLEHVSLYGNLLEQLRIGVNSKAVEERVAAMATEPKNDLK